MHSHTLKIGISGVRGIVGESLTPQLLVRFAQAFATYVGGGKVVIGRDTRTSGEMVRAALVGGLLASGCDVVDIGVAPVPTMQLAVRDLRARGGIAVTASHNPAEWNALKFVRDEGVFLNAYQAEELMEVYRQGEYVHADTWSLGKVQHDESAILRHVARLMELVDPEVIRSARPKVAVDCCNGAGAVVTPQLLRDLGCEVSEINAVPDGRFPRPPEPLPSNLGQLQAEVRKSDAGIGLAQDADADRLALVFENGQAPGEEYSLALAAEFVARKSRDGGPIVTNLSTSRMVEAVGERYGLRVIRTPVGEVNVAERMKREQALIGGEGNGGIIVPQIQYARDSLAGICLILEGMARDGRPISRIAQEALPRYFMVKDKITVPPSEIVRVMDKLRQHYEGEQLDKTEGIRALWPQAWLHIRPSNTEPIIRVIAEAATEEEANRLVEEAKAIAER